MAGFFSKVGSFLFGDKAKKHSIYNKEQEATLSRMNQYAQHGISENPLYQQGANYYQNILQGGPEAFNAFAAPYQQQFEQETLPGIAERFAGMGSGAQSSGAFRNELSQAGGNFVTGLAALRAQMQQQAAQGALNYAQAPGQELNMLGGTALSQSPFQWQQGSTGFLPQFLGGLTAGFTGEFGKIGATHIGKKIGDWLNPSTGKEVSTGLSS